MLIQLFLFGFLIATAIQLFYWLFVFTKLAFYKEKITSSNTSQGISVIICAKNEAENLKQNLPTILQQNYPKFEVIVVDDNSFDETSKILLDFQKMYPILRTITKGQEKSGRIGKKFALKLGIENARYKVLLLTDADCKPASLEWIRLMQAQLKNGAEIGLGYGPYFSSKGFLNKFVRYETVQTAIQYFSFALWRKPYMGVGRNLIYLKSLYYKSDGFKSHEHIASGDDDLFINAVSHHDNTTIILNERSFVYSAAKKTWRSFLSQKRRHLSTGTSYRLQHKVLLGLLSGSHFLHYFMGSIIWLLGFPTIFLWGYTIRMLIVMLVSRKIIQKMNELGLLVWIPLLDVIMVMYYVVFTPVLFWGAKDRWS